MPRFSAVRAGGAVHLHFDDGGMNLLSSAALRELGQLLDEVGDARLLTFRSYRPRLFAAGADMAEMQRFTARDAERFAQLGQELFDRIEQLPCPTVALIDGDCFGGALDLALAFDLRFATPRSRFSHPGARIGIVTGFGGTSRWRKVLTAPAARRLFIGNEVLSAAECGLVDRLTDDFDAALEPLLSLDPATTQLVKTLSRHAEQLSDSELLLLARRLGALHAG